MPPTPVQYRFERAVGRLGFRPRPPAPLRGERDMLIAIILLIPISAAAEVCDKGEEARSVGSLLFWSVALFLAWHAIFRQSRGAARLLGLCLIVPLLLTLLEGNSDSDPFVRAMILEGCRLPYDAALQKGLAYAALAPLIVAFSFLADRVWPRRNAPS